jgi:hypothetical protein
VITFQARAANRLFSKKTKETLKDAFKWDEWEVLSDAVKDAENDLIAKLRYDQ